MRALAYCLVMAIAVAACSGAGPTSTPTSSPAVSASPTPSGSPQPTPEELTLPEMKYALIDRLGRPWFCDPDYYPVARQDEQQLAIERFAEIQADADAFTAILNYLDLEVAPSFTDEQKLAVYREWKTLNAILLENAAGARFNFDLLTIPPPGGEQGTRTVGTIDVRGEIEIEHQEPAGEPPCPICLAPGTLIDTPAGPRRVESLRIGAPIWTVDAFGHRVEAAVAALGSTPVPPTHRLIHLVLDDGRELHASPGHPLSDGRRLSELQVGDRLEGARVVSAQRVASGSFTYDVLPTGSTGDYWADGILLGSTLER